MLLWQHWLPQLPANALAARQQRLPAPAPVPYNWLKKAICAYPVAKTEMPYQMMRPSLLAKVFSS